MADDPKKDEAEVEEKPKRRLRRTKAKDDAPKTEAGAEETTDEAEVEADVEVAEEPKAEAEEKPKAEKKSKAKAKDEVEEKPKRVIPAYDPENPPVIKAHARYVRTSARKARLVCDHIRGHSVTEARMILAHTPRDVAGDWQKLLESAVANAEHNLELDGENLRILSVQADEGPTLKRFRPRAMGRASAIHKRTSHLSISLTPKE
ncbi:MAG: 50S ribosomal protein L22 [Solirubrobacteraceae bacterium]|nr:50S ribosomal protein L22 [Solirubrobacteraceae bacterium]MBJ7342025.1 50S ribosomal protein L22 [Solirubrobacteraceae bacterium]